MARNERKGIMPKVLPVLEQLLGSVALIAGIFSGLLAGSFLMMKVLAPKLKSATGRKELLYGQPALKHDSKPQDISVHGIDAKDFILREHRHRSGLAPATSAHTEQSCCKTASGMSELTWVWRH